MDVIVRVVSNQKVLGLTRFASRRLATIDIYYKVLDDPVYIEAVLNHELVHARACEVFNKSNCDEPANFKGLDIVMPIAEKLLQSMPERQDPILYNLYSGLDNYVGYCEYHNMCNSEEMILHVYSILYILVFKYNHKELEQDYKKVLDVLKMNGFPLPEKGIYYCPSIKLEVWNPELRDFLSKFYKPNVQ